MVQWLVRLFVEQYSYFITVQIGINHAIYNENKQTKECSNAAIPSTVRLIHHVVITNITNNNT